MPSSSIAFILWFVILVDSGGKEFAPSAGARSMECRSSSSELELEMATIY
jgi:hypothetical protein